MKNFARYDGIQALRFVASVLVVITHCTFYTNERFDPSVSVWSFGTIGVDIFFAISGFVMVASTYGSVPAWKDFAARRIIRIAPMYWLATTVKVLALLVVPSVVLHAELDPTRIILSYLFLPQTNPAGRFEPILGVGWTLLYEMMFYSVFALALFLRTSPTRFVCILFSIFAGLYTIRTPEWPAASMYFHPIVLFFVIGILVFHLSRKFDDFKLWVLAGALATAFVFTQLVLHEPLLFKGYSISGFLLTSAIFVAAVAAEPRLHGRLPAWLIFMGDASYALYLFHPLIAPIVPEIMSKYWHGPSWVSVVGGIIVSLIAASIMHLMIEKPLTKILLARFVPRRDQSRASASLGGRP